MVNNRTYSRIVQSSVSHYLFMTFSIDMGYGLQLRQGPPYTYMGQRSSVVSINLVGPDGDDLTIPSVRMSQPCLNMFCKHLFSVHIHNVTYISKVYAGSEWAKRAGVSLFIVGEEFIARLTIYFVNWAHLIQCERGLNMGHLSNLLCINPSAGGPCPSNKVDRGPACVGVSFSVDPFIHREVWVKPLWSVVQSSPWL